MACGNIGVMVTSDLFAFLGREALPLAEGQAWHPAGRLASRRAVGVHLVDLFEGQALGLVDVEVNEGNADETAPKPDKEDLGLQIGIPISVIHKIRGGIGNRPV